MAPDDPPHLLEHGRHVKRYSKAGGFWEVVATWIGAMREGVVGELVRRMREEGVE